MAATARAVSPATLEQIEEALTTVLGVEPV
jgi:hypothetical protein